jgi:hypothetical protein
MIGPSPPCNEESRRRRRLLRSLWRPQPDQPMWSLWPCQIPQRALSALKLASQQASLLSARAVSPRGHTSRRASACTPRDKGRRVYNAPRPAQPAHGDSATLFAHACFTRRAWRGCSLWGKEILPCPVSRTEVPPGPEKSNKVSMQ